MNRRGFLTGLLYTPAVITTPGLLMPVRAWVEPKVIGWDMGGQSSSVVRLVNWDFKGHEAVFIVSGIGGIGSARHA